jgi:hypothetical protein
MPKIGNIRPSTQVGSGKGLEYEKFVQDIQKKLHDATGFSNVEILHNVEIYGKSGI